MAHVLEAPRTYKTIPADRKPLIDFMISGLTAAGCRILYCSPPSQAPFRITFETPTGERSGIVAYAFLATFTLTKNRPVDEHSFQVKYGSKDGELHELWQDPYGLYTTVFVGINHERDFFVAADPVLHSPTKFFIRMEFKEHHVTQIEASGWHAWERDHRGDRTDDDVEVLVGGRRDQFLRLIRFERDALGEDQGHRQLIAERNYGIIPGTPPAIVAAPSPSRLHDLAKEFALSETEVLDLIAGAGRLKMAVRGWVAEEHLSRLLRTVPGVTDCVRPEGDGQPDLILRFMGSEPIRIECKNILRNAPTGLPRVDFQRTRASKSDPCSRYYASDDFDVVAACLHARTENWDFKFAPVRALDAHPTCAGKLSHRVKLDDRWSPDPSSVFASVAGLS